MYQERVHVIPPEELVSNLKEAQAFLDSGHIPCLDQAVDYTGVSSFKKKNH